MSEQDKLEERIKYHQEHIEPCRRALVNVSKAIYTWADVLADADCASLLDYILKCLKVIDSYVDKENLSNN